jgi:pimeloyl-ACP methyl ester carboxylesterase
MAPPRPAEQGARPEGALGVLPELLAVLESHLDEEIALANKKREILGALSRRLKGEEDPRPAARPAPGGEVAAASLRQRLRDAAREQRAEIMEAYLGHLLANALGFEEATTLDPAKSPTAFGLDSFSALQTYRGLLAALELTAEELPLSGLFDKTSIRALAEFLVNEVLGLDSAPRKREPEAGPSTSEFVSAFAGLEAELSLHGRAVRYGARLQKDHPKPTLLFLHGAGSNHYIFADFLAPFSGYNLLMPSLPGRCGSAGPAFQSAVEAAGWVRELVLGLSIPRVVFVGHSLGGAIGLELALLEAELPPEQRLLRGLVLLSAGVRMPTDERVIERLGALAATVEEVPREILLFVLQSNAGLNISPRTLRAFAGALALTPLSSGLADYTASRDFARVKIPNRIDLPTLLLSGSADELVPPRYVKALERQIPGSRYVSLEGVGHHPLAEAAEIVIEQIRLFLTDSGL